MVLRLVLEAFSRQNAQPNFTVLLTQDRIRKAPNGALKRTGFCYLCATYLVFRRAAILQLIDFIGCAASLPRTRLLRKKAE